MRGAFEQTGTAMSSALNPSEARLLTDRLRNSVGPGLRYDRERTISEFGGNLQMVLQGGVLRQRFLTDGRHQTTAIYYSDDVINLSRFVRDTGGADHFLALRGTVLASVSPEMVKQLREMSQSRIDGMAALVVRELDIARERLICVGQRGALESMAHFFCEASIRARTRGNIGKRVYLPLTQEALAGLLGVSSVHVNRTLQQLRATGFLDYSDYHLVIHDFEALADLGEFDGAYLAPV